MNQRVWRVSGAVLLWSLIGAAVPASGHAQEPRLRAQVDTTEITVGDPLELRLVIDHAAGTVVLWPDSLAIAPFEVLASTTDPLADVDGGLRSAASFTITSFELGELDVPPVEVVVQSADGDETPLFSDPFRVGVVSVGLDESGEIRDIRGPLALPRNWWLLVLWGLLALGVLSAARYALHRRRTRPVVEAPPPPPAPRRPFHVLAHEALDALEASTLLEQGKVKEFHIRLSEIIRSYVEGQLEVPAMEMTTVEVVAGLRGAALGRELCDAFRRFLDRCDLVKFAKFRPVAEDSLRLLGDARTLVDRTSGTAGARMEEAVVSVAGSEGEVPA